jgi:protein SCO1
MSGGVEVHRDDRMSMAPGRRRSPLRLLMAGAMLLPFSLSGIGPSEAAVPPRAPGLTERTGQTIPGNIICLDEQGNGVRLDALIDRPTILSLVYYSCEHICPQVLVGLGRLVSGGGLGPSSGYRLITVSFDGMDMPNDAAEAKRNYTRPLPEGFPPDAWRFLTASEHDIARLTEALGFRFKREGHGFVHPEVLVVLGPGGFISRYVQVTKFAYGTAYPVAFAPVPMASFLREAAARRTGSGPEDPVLFCFPGEPSGQAGYFGLLRVAGWGTLVALAALFIFLSAGRRP